MKPRYSICLYNFYVGKPLLGLGEVARGTRTYAIRPSDEVPQYLGGVVQKTIRVASYRGFIDPRRIQINLSL